MVVMVVGIKCSSRSVTSIAQSGQVPNSSLLFPFPPTLASFLLLLFSSSIAFHLSSTPHFFFLFFFFSCSFFDASSLLLALCLTHFVQSILTSFRLTTQKTSHTILPNYTTQHASVATTTTTTTANTITALPPF